MQKIRKLITTRRYIPIIAAVIFGVIVGLTIIACYQIITPYKKYIRTQENAEYIQMGMVLGAGINEEGKPYDELKARLDVAADALNKRTVDGLILSGDNRFKDYNEPAAMEDYLVNQRSITRDKLVLDYAGRSTYESCERANKVFGIKKLIIFSAESHLPRAIYLCRHFGIESYGIASGIEADNSARREPLARIKAIYNVYIHGEQTILD